MCKGWARARTNVGNWIVWLNEIQSRASSQCGIVSVASRITRFRGCQTNGWNGKRENSIKRWRVVYGRHNDKIIKSMQILCAQWALLTKENIDRPVTGITSNGEYHKLNNMLNNITIIICNRLLLRLPLVGCGMSFRQVLYESNQMDRRTDGRTKWTDRHSSYQMEFNNWLLMAMIFGTVISWKRQMKGRIRPCQTVHIEKVALSWKITDKNVCFHFEFFFVFAIRFKNRISVGTVTRQSNANIENSEYFRQSVFIKPQHQYLSTFDGQKENEQSINEMERHWARTGCRLQSPHNASHSPIVLKPSVDSRRSNIKAILWQCFPWKFITRKMMMIVSQRHSSAIFRRTEIKSFYL